MPFGTGYFFIYHPILTPPDIQKKSFPDPSAEKDLFWIIIDPRDGKVIA